MAKDEQQNKITLNYSNNFLITVIIIIIPGFTSITLLNGHMQATTPGVKRQMSGFGWFTVS